LNFKLSEQNELSGGAIKKAEPPALWTRITPLKRKA